MIRVESIDLFGARVVTEISEARRKVKCTGYAAAPGTGPQGESCKTCGNAVRVEYHNRVYYKCRLMQTRWTNGPGSDIRLKSPACRHWEKETE